MSNCLQCPLRAESVHYRAVFCAVLNCVDKSLFERPPELYGKFGEAARRATREDQYPDIARFGEYTGSRWREVFDYHGVLPQESLDHGMKNICPRAGDVLVMPESLTHGVLPWLPKDRARYAMLMTITPSDRGKHSMHSCLTWCSRIIERQSDLWKLRGWTGNGAGLPNKSSVPPEIFDILSPETQELTQFATETKQIARTAMAPKLTLEGTNRLESKL